MTTNFATNAPGAQGRTADPLDRARWLLFEIIVTDAQGAHLARDARKRELLVIGSQVGPDFGPLLVDRAGVWLAKRLKLPQERYHEAVTAIRRDFKRLIDPLAYHLAISGPEAST